MTKSMKRIHKVTIKRMIDDSPDTSDLGEYGNKPESKYAIDRAHSEDCRAQYGAQEYVVQLYNTDGDEDGAGVFLDRAKAEEYKTFHAVGGFSAEITEQDAECDCGFSGHWDNREYRYFNPNWENYEGLEESEIRQYCRQDFDRMESLNNQQWGFIGIRADAEYSVNGDMRQKVTSGGLWGIESDSGDDYFTEVEQEQLAELKSQLAGIGFSSRAIAAAFKEIKHKDE